MRIAVASGKGGTGKTLISMSLAHLWSEAEKLVTYVDADAEEPNGHLFLKPEIGMETRFTVWIPGIGGAECAGHGKCQEICAFNAILSTKGSVIVFNELCHSCGACILACPDQALEEQAREIGCISFGKAGDIDFVAGKLDVGEARVTPLIKGVVEEVSSKPGFVIVDAPPGTSCSAMAAVSGADLLVLVTEPTPFGMHDLVLAVGMGRALGLKLVSVINRADLGDDQTRTYLRKEGIPILAEIPFDRAIAEAYAAGKLPIDDCDPFMNVMGKLSDRLLVALGEVH